MNAKDQRELEWCRASGRAAEWFAKGQAIGRLKCVELMPEGQERDTLLIRAQERLSKAEAVVAEILSGPNPHPQPVHRRSIWLTQEELQRLMAMPDSLKRMHMEGDGRGGQVVFIDGAKVELVN